MAEKKLVLVMGASSSGTRVMESVFKKLDYRGSANTHHYDWLELPSDKVVWRRSFPHGGLGNRYWPDIPSMAEKGKDKGYSVYGVMIHRDPLITAMSQVRAKHNVSFKVSVECVKMAMVMIPDGFDRAKIPWVPVLYDRFVESPRAVMHYMSLELELPELDADPPIYITNGNAKYEKLLDELDIE